MAGPTTFGFQVLGFGAGKTSGGGATTTLIYVDIAEFDEFDDCACSLDSMEGTKLVDDGASGFGSGAGLSPSVGDWISVTDAMMMGGPWCGQVTEINVVADEFTLATGYTSAAYDDCADCNDGEEICSTEGPGPGGPGPP